jgi:hypothetical protein
MARQRGVTSDTGPFALIPEWLLDSGVSDRAVRLYAVLARYADNDTGIAFPSKRLLATRLGCSDDSVTRAQKELEAADALRVEARFADEGDRTSNNYVVLRVGPRTPAGTGGRTVAGAGTRTTLELDTVGANAPTAQPSAQEIVAHYIDDARDLGYEPPRRVVGQIARQVGELLDEGQPPDLITAALVLMTERRLHPSTLPTLIGEAALGPARRRQERDPDLDGALAAAQRGIDSARRTA